MLSIWLSVSIFKLLKPIARLRCLSGSIKSLTASTKGPPAVNIPTNPVKAPMRKLLLLRGLLLFSFLGFRAHHKAENSVIVNPTKILQKRYCLLFLLAILASFSQIIERLARLSHCWARSCSNSCLQLSWSTNSGNNDFSNIIGDSSFFAYLL